MRARSTQETLRRVGAEGDRVGPSLARSELASLPTRGAGNTNGGLPPVLARELAAFIRAEVRAAVRATAGGDADPWMPHPQWPCASRRAACALARSGEIEGVRRVGQGRGALYLVRRSALDAWIERESATGAEPEPADDFELAMARSGLRRGAAPVSPAPRAARGGR